MTKYMTPNRRTIITIREIWLLPAFAPFAAVPLARFKNCTKFIMNLQMIIE